MLFVSTANNHMEMPLVSCFWAWYKILCHAAPKETENTPSEVAEESPAVPEVQETESVDPPVPESKAEESVSKDEPEQEETASGSTRSTFTYEQLRARSENPVTGIDFKRREVSPQHLVIPKSYAKISYFVRVSFSLFWGGRGCLLITNYHHSTSRFNYFTIWRDQLVISLFVLLL